MANFPLKTLISLLQRRSLQTKVSTLPPKPSETLIKKQKSEQTLPAVRENGESVIALLKSQQFSEPQIAKLIERCPRILNARVSSTLEPKLRFLNENGFTGTLLPHLVVSNPVILLRSLNAHLIPSLEFLRTQLGKNNEFALHTVIKRASWVLTSNLDKYLRRNMLFLEKEGMPVSSISKLFTSYPRSLLCNMNRVIFGVKTVKEFGIKPHEPMFVHALRVVLRLNESSLKKKMEVFKSLGWSDADLISSVVRQPLVLTCSPEKLKKNIEFLVKTMKVEHECIIANPKLVMYSLEKRIIPRCNVLKLLQEKKLVRKRSITSMLDISDGDFVRKFVLKHIDRVPYLLDVYNGDRKSGIAAVEL